MHAVFPHQHLVGGVGADGLAVQLPDEVGGGQAAHLRAGKGAIFTHDESETFDLGVNSR